MSDGISPDKGRTHLFLLSFVLCISIAFLWVVVPFAGAILWAVIAAILFEPLNARLLVRMPGRRNIVALITLLAIMAIVVVPAMLLGSALLRETTSIFAGVRSGAIVPGRLLDAALGHLPDWGRHWLADLGLGDMDGIRARLSQTFASSLQTVAARILAIGQGTFGFFLSLGVMLYLTFFLLRDGHQLAARIERVLPLSPLQREILTRSFVQVIRATIKGGAIVAVLQGATGGVIFWALGLPGALLWGVAMGVASLFPAIGTGFVWVPAAVYLLVTGAVWQGILLLLCGFFIISSIDNVVRPILVGRDARMPDYVVLVTTLGGFEVLGFNGFVVGPLVAALFLATWEIYSSAREAGAEAASTSPLGTDDGCAP